MARYAAAMTILNLMLGKKRGGLEQAAIDYAESLQVAGIPALTLISPEAWVEAPLVVAGVPHQSLTNHARWDPLAILRLRHVARKTKATAILCHGNRALTLALLALRGRVPVIAIAHNYQTRRFLKADGCLAITQHLATHVTRAGVRHVSLMPNMVRMHDEPLRAGFRNSPPVIGSLGRFVEKKGFSTFIEALAILKQRTISFNARLGGEGELAEALVAQIAHHGLSEQVTLSGWVQDKHRFFNELDLFVLPSRHEPFGIVLLEAMSYGVPVITTDAEGPREIVHPNIDALLTPRGDAPAMADAIAALLENPLYARALAQAGHRLVAHEYSGEAMATRLKTALMPYITPHV